MDSAIRSRWHGDSTDLQPPPPPYNNLSSNPGTPLRPPPSYDDLFRSLPRVSHTSSTTRPQEKRRSCLRSILLAAIVAILAAAIVYKVIMPRVEEACMSKLVDKERTLDASASRLLAWERKLDRRETKLEEAERKLEIPASGLEEKKARVCASKLVDAEKKRIDFASRLKDAERKLEAFRKQEEVWRKDKKTHARLVQKCNRDQEICEAERQRRGDVNHPNGRPLYCIILPRAIRWIIKTMFGRWIGGADILQICL